MDSTQISRQAILLEQRASGLPAGRLSTLEHQRGSNHTTVLHSIAKIERLRQTDEGLDALIEVLTAALSPTLEGQLTRFVLRGWSTALIDAVAARVLEQISGTTAG